MHVEVNFFKKTPKSSEENWNPGSLQKEIPYKNLGLN